ncbi:cell division protein FtsL [Anaerosolibacter carboniphilus]|uniref:Cell division protein FtsL n=1 Tax=Anaerosolibacter carboniphilus TaxID=1417629 RepID=A0A841L1G8_9FIRM|nr:cell division protein FtsL [Anaerosolibacter carboniphilus]MBB6217012.1 cell division protein FtsL [Anaerosolibacter carboniphilus]
MVVAQRKHEYYALEDAQKEQIKKQPSASQKRQAMRAAHKLQIIFSVVMVASLCVAILLGYVSLTETKYRVHALETEIKQLEGQIENYRVQAETFKKSTIVEERAIAELGMQYPTKNQMVFLNIDNSTDTGAQETKEEMGKNADERDYSIISGVKDTFHKIYSLLD